MCSTTVVSSTSSSSSTMRRRTHSCSWVGVPPVRLQAPTTVGLTVTGEVVETVLRRSVSDGIAGDTAFDTLFPLVPPPGPQVEDPDSDVGTSRFTRYGWGSCDSSSSTAPSSYLMFVWRCAFSSCWRGNVSSTLRHGNRGTSLWETLGGRTL